MRPALLFIRVCVFCFLFVLSFLVWFFLWLPEEVLTLLFFLHHENGDFCILMKDIFLFVYLILDDIAGSQSLVFLSGAQHSHCRRAVKSLTHKNSRLKEQQEFVTK